MLNLIPMRFERYPAVRFASPFRSTATNTRADTLLRQNAPAFAHAAKAVASTALALSLAIAGAPLAMAQESEAPQAAMQNETTEEDQSVQDQQTPALEPVQPAGTETDPTPPADDAASSSSAGENESTTPEDSSPADGADAEGDLPSENPTSSQTPLDANAEPLNDAESEAEEGEEEEKGPEAQAETRAGEMANVSNWDDFENAVNDTSVSVINVQDTIDGSYGAFRNREIDIRRPLTITSDKSHDSEDNEIWYTSFVVCSGGSLTLAGNIFLNGNVGFIHSTIDTVTVNAGGSLNVQDNARVLADNGTGASSHKPPEGIAVVIDGGNATINTSSRIEGSSGGLLISENGGTCTVYSGTFATEAKITELGWTDFGHAAIDNINGKLTLQGNGSNIRIDSLENSGTLFATGAAFEEVYFRNDSGNTNGNPIFNNQDTTGGESTSGDVAHTGRAWLYDCSFTKPNDGSKGIYAEGPTYVYAPASGESHALKVNGTYYYSEAPEIAWNGGKYTFKVANSASDPAANVRRCYLGSNLPVSSFDAFRDAIGGDLNNNVIADTTSFSSSISVDPSTNNAANMPYALAAFDYPVDEDDVFHVFGPTSELNLMSVDVQWGDMTFTISPSPASDNWNPSSHTYELMDIDFNIRPKDGPWSDQVWVTKNSSVRPITATATFAPEEQFNDVFEGSYTYTYLGDSTKNYEGAPLTLDDRRLTFQLNLSFKSDPLIYSLDHDKIGTATVTIGYAS